MAIVTNLDPQRRFLPHGLLLVEEVSIDEEVWQVVEDYLEENGKDKEVKFDSNFRITSEGKCTVQLSKINII
jgi:hypothetical protein